MKLVEIDAIQLRVIVLLLFTIIFFPANAQHSNHNNWNKKLKDFQLEPIVGIQLWSTYSFGMSVYDEARATYEEVDNRFNTQIRRTRLGVKGEPYKNLKFNITAALDLVGRDLLSATQGGANNGASPAFRLWNAFLQLKIFDKSDFLHLTSGYFIPQIGRESITGAMNVSSMEKSWSQNYLRRQLVGTGPGRAVGFNLGGLFLLEHSNFGFGYDLGLFNPVYTSLSGNSIGRRFSLLSTARVAFYIGDAESKKYTLSHQINYYGKRKGLTIAFSTAYQGGTDFYKNNIAVGADWLFNWAGFNLDGEWTFLTKRALINEEQRFAEFSVRSNTGYLRLSYNITLANNRIIEPAFMLVQFNGATESLDQSRAASVNSFAGKDYSYDLGINYHFNPKLKLTAHYIFRTGESGDMFEGADFNSYFYQKGVGAIERGDWIGLGCTAIF